MLSYQYILARGNGSGDLLQLAILAVVLIVGAIAKKFGEKAQQKKAEEEYHRRRAEREAHERQQAGLPPRPPQPVSPSMTRQPAGRHYAEQTAMRSGAEAGQRSFQTSQAAEAGERSFTPASRAAARPAARPAAAAIEPEQRVEGELDRQQARRADEDLRRQQRMATIAPAEADTAAIEARIAQIHSRQWDADTVERGEPALSLGQLGDLRRAILAFEIFSPPKALRMGREFWEI
ncbi:MAG: hypothetical protein WC869_13350 [Phycisphaerae bacterium]|jgi:hypothetical protein